jgi:hypothetical protein
MNNSGFVELLFKDSLSVSSARCEGAYESLALNPHQIFGLLLDGEPCTRFTSGLAIYGKRLARIFDRFPDSFPPEPEDLLHLDKKDFNSGLVEEMLRAFTFLLIARNPTDTQSREALADIVMSVIKLSHPEALKQLGEKLGETPRLLGKLISDGRMGDLSHGQPKTYRGLVSGDGTYPSWRSVIVDLTRGCAIHHPNAQRGVGGSDILKVLRVFPCGTCALAEDEPTEDPVLREYDIFGTDMRPNTFERLLGDRLGVWKVILSAQAMRDLNDSVGNGEYTQRAHFRTSFSR